MTTKHHSRRQKAAIQMSLGMIVALIFAVILLTSLLAWLSGMMADITDITHEVSAIAKQNLIEDLETSDKRVGVASPAITTWERGENGAFSLGVKNINPNSLTTYYYNIYLESVGGELAGNDVNLYFDDANLWLTSSGSIDVPPGASITTDIILEPALDSAVGTYQFRVAVCEDPPGSACHSASEDIDITGWDEPSDSLYGSDQFGIDIE